MESVSVRCRYCDSRTSIGADACGSGGEMFFKKKLPTGTDNKLFRHMRVVMHERRGSFFWRASRLRIRMYRYGLRESRCRYRPDTKRNNKSKWNQYRCGTGIAIREIASVRMHADPEAGYFSKKNCLPVSTIRYSNTRELLCARGGFFFKKRCLPYGSACIGTDCASRDTGTMRLL
jgi:hypothetical protein